MVYLKNVVRQLGKIPHAANESDQAMDEVMRQAYGKKNWLMRDYESREFFLNHPIRKLESYVNKADPRKEEAKCLSTNQMAGNGCR